MGVAAESNHNSPQQKSYYQYPPSQTLPPGSIWNPIITEKDGTTYKSYYQYGPSNETLPPGSLWNPLVTEKGYKKKVISG